MHVCGCPLSTGMLKISHYNCKTLTSYVQLDVSLPEGRHSHCALAYHNSVIIIGGLDSAMQPLASCLQLTCGADRESWEMSVVEFEVPLPSRLVRYFVDKTSKKVITMYCVVCAVFCIHF